MHNRIKEVRIQSNLALRPFGEKIGISATSIMRIEKGENNPSEQTIRAICSVFNVNRQWLETGEGEMYVPRGEDAAFMERVLAEHGSDPLLKAFLSAYLDLDDQRRKALEDFVFDFSDHLAAARAQGETLSLEDYMAARAAAPAELKTSG